MFVITTRRDLYCFAVLSEHIIQLHRQGFLFYWAHVIAGWNILSCSIVSSQRLFYILPEVCPAGQRHNPRHALHTLHFQMFQILNWQRQTRVSYTSCWLTSVFGDSPSLINPYKMSLNSFQSVVSAIIWRIHIIFDHYAVTGWSLIKSSNFLTSWTCVANAR